MGGWWVGDGWVGGRVYPKLFYFVSRLIDTDLLDELLSLLVPFVCWRKSKVRQESIAVHDHKKRSRVTINMNNIRYRQYKV